MALAAATVASTYCLETPLLPFARFVHLRLINVVLLFVCSTFSLSLVQCNGFPISLRKNIDRSKMIPMSCVHHWPKVRGICNEILSKSSILLFCEMRRLNFVLQNFLCGQNHKLRFLLIRWHITITLNGHEIWWQRSESGRLSCGS